jgi:hypothetical protein
MATAAPVQAMATPAARTKSISLGRSIFSASGCDTPSASRIVSPRRGFVLVDFKRLEAEVPAMNQEASPTHAWLAEQV